MEINAELVRIDKEIMDASSSDFTTMASEATSSFTTLKANIDALSEAISMPDVWDDNISMEISGNVHNGMNGMIDACMEPVASVITPTGPRVDELKTSIKLYFEAVDNYNDEVIKRDECLKNEPKKSDYYTIAYTYTDEETGKEKTGYSFDNNGYGKDYASWSEQLALHESNMVFYKTAAETWETDALAKIAALQALLSPTGANTAGASLGGNVTSVVEELLDDGRTKKGYKIIDENGNIIGESYQIIGTDNKTVEQSGIVTYNEDGTRTDEYTHFAVDGTTKKGTSSYSSTGVLLSDSYTTISKDGIKQEGVITYENGIKTLEEYTITEGASTRKGEIFYENNNAYYSEEVNVTTDLGDGKTKTGIQYVDTNGNVLAENYQVTNVNGEVEQSGTVQYVNGQKAVEEYTMTVDGTPRNGTIKYDVTAALDNGQMQIGTQFLDGEGKIVEERYKITNSSGDILREGTIKYDSDGNATYHPKSE